MGICGYGGIGRHVGFRFQWHRRAGSSPVTRTTSSQAPYRLRRRFFRRRRSHSAAPPFQIKPTSLGFDLVSPFGLLFSQAPYRLRRRFSPSTHLLRCASFPNQTHSTPLGFDLVSPAGGTRALRAAYRFMECFLVCSCTAVRSPLFRHCLSM